MIGNIFKSKVFPAKKTFGLLAVVTLLFFTISCKNDNDNKKVSFQQESLLTQKIDNIINEMNLPGVTVRVAASNNREYALCRGVSNIKTNIPRSFTDPFRIASITKTFTASVIHILISEGKLSTSQKLSEFFPDFPNAENITIRNLLRMRSGIADFADSEFLELLYNDPLVKFTNQELIQMSADKAASFYKPDSITRYTNVNYTLLGEIAAQIEGQDIGTLIHEKIITPLGLTGTIYPANSDLPGNNRGYCWESDIGKFVDYTVLNPLWAGAGGAMISTTKDLETFARALYYGDLWTPDINASKNETIQMENAPPFIKYGEGIIQFGNFWGHNGTIFGFSSEIWYLPQEDATIIINVNRLDLDDHSKSTKIFLAVTKTLFPEYTEC